MRFRRLDRIDRTDRILAAFEIPLLGLWFGSLVAFAAFFAPGAFRALAPLDVARFATLVADQLGALTVLGFVCGGLAAILALLRSRNAADRRWDAARAALLLVALGAVAYHATAIVPAMRAMTDVHGAAYHALHARSSGVYGAITLLVLGALVLAAGQPGSER